MEIPGRYFAFDPNFPKERVRPFIRSLQEKGFTHRGTEIGKGEVTQRWGKNNDKEEVLIIADEEGVEVTGDYPTGPIIRDRG